MKKKMIAFLLAACMLLAMVACNTAEKQPDPDPSKDPGPSQSTPADNLPAEDTPTASADPVTITIGMAATHVEISNIKHHAERWKELTGNTLDVQAVDDNQFSQLVLTKMTNGGMWDIILGATGTEGSIYNHAKYFADLSGEPWVSRLNDACLPFMQVDGVTYGFPTGGINSFGIVYNKEVFANLNLEVPSTFDQFEEVCNTLRDAGITPIEVSMGDPWTVNQIINGEWPNILHANPGLLEKLNNNEIRWDEVPEVVDMFSRMEQWVDNGWVNSDLTTTSYEMAQKAIGSGTAAMMYMGDWADPEYIKTVPEAAGKIGMFAAPTKDGDPYLAAAGPSAYYVSKDSKNLDAVKSFLNYLASEEAIQYDLDTKACTSVWVDVESSNVTGTLADSQVYFDQGKSESHYNQTYVIVPSDDACSAFLSILLKQKTPEECAKLWSDELIKTGKQLGLDGFAS